jgi:hypothetical protein
MYDAAKIRKYNRKRGIKSNIPVNKRNKKKKKRGRPIKVVKEEYKNPHEILRITCPKDESPFHLPFLYSYSIITIGQEGCLFFGSSKPYKN